MNEAGPIAAAIVPAAASVAAPATPGARLRAERERRGLSLQKAADEMHLDGWVIGALESDDYQRIGPAVFAKGHLKKYAEILGLPAAEFLDGFEARRAGIAVPSAQNSRDASHDDGIADPPGMRLAGAALVLVAAAVAAGLWWWKPWHPRENSSSLSDAVVQAPAPIADGPAPAAADADEVAAKAAAAQAAAQAAPAADATLPTQPAVMPAHAVNAVMAAKALPLGNSSAVASPSPAPGAGRAHLRLSFSADSRVEVRDATGKLVFGGMGQANSVKQISGMAPLHIYLSDAGGVQLEINDRAVAIGAKFLSGNVAHFDAGADGVLRRDTAAGAEQRPRG